MHKQATIEKPFEDLKQIFEAKLKTSMEWNSSISYAEHASQKGDIVPLDATREHWEHLINSHASLMACYEQAKKMRDQVFYSEYCKAATFFGNESEELHKKAREHALQSLRLRMEPEAKIKSQKA